MPEKMNDIPELLPCPFCGMRPDWEDQDTIYPTGTVWRDDPELEGLRTYHRRKDMRLTDGQVWGMHCPTPAGGCGAQINGDSMEEAIAKWNRRSEPRPQ